MYEFNFDFFSLKRFFNYNWHCVSRGGKNRKQLLKNAPKPCCRLQILIGPTYAIWLVFAYGVLQSTYMWAHWNVRKCGVFWFFSGGNDNTTINHIYCPIFHFQLIPVKVTACERCTSLSLLSLLLVGSISVDSWVNWRYGFCHSSHNPAL